MAQRDFRINKFFGYGCYSFVYSATSTRPHDKGESYALKRFFLSKSTTLYFAEKEHNILKRIALDPQASRFLPTLYYSLVIENSPILVLTEALGLTLCDVTDKIGPLTGKQAKFYLKEIICGLKYLHSISIVHMELKSSNIMIAKTGHILLADFDRSFDLSRWGMNTFPDDFSVNLYHAAPEIANHLVITDRADVWSLGALTSLLIGKGIRPKIMDRQAARQAAMAGRWHISEFSKLPGCWQEFFNQVFTFSYIQRPNIEAVQNLALFSNVNWDKVERHRFKPPFSAVQLKAIADELNDDFNPKDPVLLKCAFSSHMPKVNNCKFEYKTDSNGHRSFILIQPDFDNLSISGFTKEELEEYNFIHPVLNYRRLLSQ